MISLADVSGSGYQTVSAGAMDAASALGTSSSGVFVASEVQEARDAAQPSCSSCAAYRVSPVLQGESDERGNLRVDPEIHLPSPGMDVDVAYFYNSSSTDNGLFGYGRTLNLNLTAQASGARLLVTLARGNGVVVSYLESSIGSGQFVPQSPGLINTLDRDTPNNLWKETTPEGTTTAYPLNTTGQVTTVTYREDAVGNRHTFAYTAGRLQTLQDAVGRTVSFGYVNQASSGSTSNTLLQSIQDWAGRRTTFAYDTMSVAGKPLLTQVTGPSGCVTQYGYDGTARLTSITDPNGYGTSYSYDAQGRVATRRVATAGTTVYSYTAGATLVTDALSQVTTHLLDSKGKLVQTQRGNVQESRMIGDAKGLEVGRRNALGGTQRTLRNAAGQITTAVSPAGGITLFARDAWNNTTATIAPDGTITTQVWGYAGSSFDTTGQKRRLQAVTDALGNTTGYSYNARGQMTGTVDALGNRTTWNYDSFGNQTSTVDALGNVTTRSYDLAGNVVATQDALGYVSSVTYDAMNRPLTLTDPLGYVTTTGYDSVGNPVVRIDPLGARTTATYNVFNAPVSTVDSLGYVSTNVYNAIGQQIASIDALGYATTMTYDAAGQVVDSGGSSPTTTVYNAAGLPIASVDVLGYRTTTVYDIAERPVAEIDQAGYATTTVYDAQDRPVATMDALGRLTTTVYDLLGRVQATIDPLGSYSTIVYDALSRPVATMDALGRINTTVYDALGRMVTTQNALGYVTSYGYDALGRSVRVQDARGSISSAVYDARGLLVTSVEPRGWLTTSVYDAAGRSIAQVNVLGNRTSAVYDVAGRAIASVDAMGYRTSRVYDAVGQQLAIIDALNRRTTTVYDRWGKVTAEQDARGFRTSFAYDALDRQIAVIDALGNRTTSLFDGRGMLTGTQMAWGALTGYSYDGVGNATSRVDGRGLRTSYVYDALDRPSVMIKPEGTRVTLAYDAVGQLLTSSESFGVTSTVYDALGQVTDMALPTGARLSYAYDSIGNRAWMSDDTGARTTYLYASATGAGANYLKVTPPYEATPNNVSEVRFDKLGRVDFRAMADARASQQTQRFLPNGWKSHNSYTSFAGVEQNYFGLGYDQVGNQTAMSQRNGGSGSPMTYTYFGYDASNQLINERRADTPGFNTSYSYDGVGNRLVQNASGVLTSYVYGSGNRLMTETTGSAVTSYSYDQNGNTMLVNAGGSLTTYLWDGENRLKQVANPDGSSEQHEYDLNGLRRKKQVTSPSSAITTTMYVWDGQSLLQERNESNLLLSHNSWAPETWNGQWSGGEIDDVLFLERRASTPGDMAGGTSRYHGEDPSYNTRLLVDPTGTVSDRYVYESFGEVFSHSGSGGTTPFLFGGALGYYADASKRTYVRARHYDPTTGRWVSEDPIGFDGGDANLYRYVGNMPVNGVDPSGFVTRGEVLYNWLHEADQPNRVFGPKNQVTKDVRSLSTIKTCRQSWIAAGCPKRFPPDRKHQDKKSKKQRAACYYRHEFAKYADDVSGISSVVLGFFSSYYASGQDIIDRQSIGAAIFRKPLDPQQLKKDEIAAFNQARIQAVLGSFSVIIQKVGKCNGRFSVENVTGWESFGRTFHGSLASNAPRVGNGAGVGGRSKIGIGGNYKQTYTWIEKGICPSK